MGVTPTRRSWSAVRGHDGQRQHRFVRQDVPVEWVKTESFAALARCNAFIYNLLKTFTLYNKLMLVVNDLTNHFCTVHWAVAYSARCVFLYLPERSITASLGITVPARRRLLKLLLGSLHNAWLDSLSRQADSAAYRGRFAYIQKTAFCPDIDSARHFCSISHYGVNVSLVDQRSHLKRYGLGPWTNKAIATLSKGLQRELLGSRHSHRPDLLIWTSP